MILPRKALLCAQIEERRRVCLGCGNPISRNVWRGVWDGEVGLEVFCGCNIWLLAPPRIREANQVGDRDREKRSLLLSDIPSIVIGGQPCYKFTKLTG